MARRTLQGLLPRLVNLIRGLLQAGVTYSQLIASAFTSFPEIAEQRIKRTIRTEIDRHQRVQAVLSANWGQFADTLAALNCPEGTRGFRIGMTVRGRDANTGASITFGHSVVVAPGKRIGDILTQAYAGVVDEARRFNYQIGAERRFTRDLLASTQIHFIDCI